jgi:hypothetical protein
MFSRLRLSSCGISGFLLVHLDGFWDDLMRTGGVCIYVVEGKIGSHVMEMKFEWCLYSISCVCLVFAISSDTKGLVSKSYLHLA